MRVKIFSFVKPSRDATLFAHEMSRFMSQTLKVPVTWGDDIAKGDTDLLIIVGGGVIYCQHLPALAKAILRSERVAYCTNDYGTTKLPGPENKGKTPYRRAFRIRARDRAREPEFWSSVEGGTRYIPWNMIAWNPDVRCWRPSGDGERGNHLFYYGSWRKNRREIFDLFFKDPAAPTVISNGSHRFEQYKQCRHEPSTKRTTLIHRLGRAGLGLYVSDPHSCEVVDGPACRFFEMLSAGLPMVFHAPCLPALAKVGIVPDHHEIVSDANDIPSALYFRRKIASMQERWRKDYTSIVEKRIIEAVRGKP